jgi:hypothetical protein
MRRFIFKSHKRGVELQLKVSPPKKEEEKKKPRICRSRRDEEQWGGAWGPHTGKRSEQYIKVAGDGGRVAHRMWRLKVEDSYGIKKSSDLFSMDNMWVSLQVEGRRWRREEVREGGDKPSLW